VMHQASEDKDGKIGLAMPYWLQWLLRLAMLLQYQGRSGFPGEANGNAVNNSVRVGNRGGAPQGAEPRGAPKGPASAPNGCWFPLCAVNLTDFSLL